MKLVSLLPIASLASLGLVSATDVPFSSTNPAWKANFKTSGGEIQYCPTGDCAATAFSVKVTKIEEYTPGASGAPDTSVKLADLTLGTVTDWTALVNSPASGTAVGKTSTYVQGLKKDASTELGTLTLSAVAYTTASTASFAGATLTIPVSSVKFTAGIDGWDPAAGNKVKMELTVTSTAKASGGSSQAALALASAVGTDTISKTVTIGDGMYLDVATKAEAGSTPDEIAVTPAIDGAKVVLVFDTFNGKTPLKYDPVMYYKAPENPAVTTAAPTTAPTNSTTPAPSGASSVWGYAASVFVGAAAIAAMMV
ncbi:hypothetical protein Poli38472_005763 [Pythium oligandrum]|uniref:Uncharacterized protein n=1 Tax=Pythium oligandrum TaxID=41045 RepID=A0A8K1CT48_PYTOL|nr:hypothetical protein Poli38472_005759 [Pythium oligandrum]TMW68292.1 hypothetical protein Poli38472_005760 [Pythium oligandrum]TMW68293.1 hypothetical protein Poli38472_005761 [Pythium oligandrum]TMW68294.1 hypothetical protein Poli38472_005762 [Pythium oligandrum]TMW68295.1 hypothetical protein Poli38472_005763 [Pythium oligandrum]|eukprot:TMW68291.1 hypothetical protein Poli38472_005759 [Pythium oligandrum]